MSYPINKTNCNFGINKILKLHKHILELMFIVMSPGTQQTKFKIRQILVNVHEKFQLINSEKVHIYF